MDRILTEIAQYLILQSWQIAVVFVVVAIACRLLRNASAHWRYLLWMVVLAKCLAPPLLTVPLAVLPAGEKAAVAQGPVWPEPVVAAVQEAEAPREPEVAQAAPIAANEAVEMVPQEGASLAPAWTEAAPSAPASPVTASPTASIAPLGPAAVLEPASAARLLTLWQWTSIGWVVGGIFLLAVAGLRAVRIQRQVRGVRRPVSAELAAELAELAGRLGLRSAPQAWLIDGIAQPFVWGVLRGRIYLPGNFARTGTAAHRRGILMHELAHVARYDAAVNLVQVIVQAAFFFHPLVWWANKRIRQEREKCCDEVAIAQLGAPPRQYGQAIVESLVREYETTQPVSSLAVAGPVKNIEERIQTILRPNRRFYRSPSRLAVVSVAVLAALAVPTTVVLTVRPAEEKPAALAVEPAASATPSSPEASTDKPTAAFTTSKAEDRVEETVQPATQPGMPGRGEPQTASTESTPDALIPPPAQEDAVATPSAPEGATAQPVPEEATRGPAPRPVTPKVTVSRQVPAHYRGTLPSGVNVELLNVARPPYAQNNWWRPDGSPAKRVGKSKATMGPGEVRVLKPWWLGSRAEPRIAIAKPRDNSGMPTHTPKWPVEPLPEEKTVRLAFALLLDKLPRKDATATWIVSPSDSRMGRQAVDLEHVDTDEAWAFTEVVAADGESVDVRVGIAAGEWKAFDTVPPQETTRYYEEGVLSVRPSAARDGLASVHVVSTFDDVDVRIVAIDQKGKAHESRSGISGEIRQRSGLYVLNVPLEKIVHFQVQTRPFEWITFRNVSTAANRFSEVGVDVQSRETAEAAGTAERKPVRKDAAPQPAASRPAGEEQAKREPQTRPAGSQPAGGHPGALMFTLTGDLKEFPSQAPAELFEQLKAGILSPVWGYQSGDLYSFTFRNPAPEREATRTVSTHTKLTPEQTKLLVDASICFVDVMGGDEESVLVQATVFVRSKTSAEAAKAFAEKIDVELAVDGANVRLGDHYGTFRSKDIESAGVWYRVKVPRRFAVDVRIPNGRLTVQDIDGGLVFIGGGSIAASHIGGRVIVDNGNGTTLLHDVKGPERTSIDHGNGSVALLGIGGPLNLNLRNGGVYLDSREAAPPAVGAVIDHGRMNIIDLKATGRTGLTEATFNAGRGATVRGADGSVMQANVLHITAGQADADRKWTVNAVDGQINIWQKPSQATKFGRNVLEPEAIAAERINLDFTDNTLRVTGTAVTGRSAAQSQPAGAAARDPAEVQAANMERMREEFRRLSDEVHDARNHLEAKRQEIAAFIGDEARIPGILNQSNVITDNLMRLGQMRTEAKARMEALKSQYEAWQKGGQEQVPASPEMIAAVEADAQIAALEKRRAELVEQRASLIARYGKEHRQVRDFEVRIEAIANEAQAKRLEKITLLKQQKLEQGRLDMLAAVDQVSQIDQEYREAEAAQTDLDRKRARLDDLLNEKKWAEERLDRATRAYQELQYSASQTYRDPVLQPGDVVDISIYGGLLREEQAENVFRRQISEEGDTSLPVLGRISLAGLTPRQAEEMLEKKIVPEILRTANVSVTIVQRYGGAARAPGTQPGR